MGESKLKSANINVSVVVNTCDAYSDVLDIFFHAWRENWPDCPYPIVINTETANYDYPARTHRFDNGTGADDWGARLLATLSTVETDFVLMVCDDFILEDLIDVESIEDALHLLEQDEDAAAIYLIDTGLDLAIPKSKNDKFIPLNSKAQYRLNSAPAIWRKQILLDYTAAGDTPWAWEVFGTYRTWGDKKTFYSLNPTNDPVFNYNYSKGGAIYRGKWVREVVDSVAEKYPLSIDWNERGFSSDTVLEKRSLIWKLQFIKIGFRMVGFKALYFLASYIRDKINER